jgi:hypothetical protein
VWYLFVHAPNSRAFLFPQEDRQTANKELMADANNKKCHHLHRITVHPKSCSWSSINSIPIASHCLPFKFKLALFCSKMMFRFSPLFLLGVVCNGFAPRLKMPMKRHLEPSKRPIRNGLELCASAMPRMLVNETSYDTFDPSFSAVAAVIKLPNANTASPTTQQTIVSTAMLVMLNFMFSRILKSFGFSFPSSLAGMGFLFATFLVVPGGETVYQVLKPGANLMAKWLQVFLVPNLVILPLAAGLGSTMEVSF